MPDSDVTLQSVTQAALRLAEAGCDNPQREARLLWQYALGLSHWALAASPATPQQLVQFEALLQRREQREPLAQIIGRKEFWSLDFYVNTHTLTPRPDSETVVEAALTCLPQLHLPYRLLDLGTGSGCLLLALLHERPNATGLGVDRSREALTIAARNASNLGLGERAEFALGDWAQGINARFDMVISNPPYIPQGDIAGLMPEVRDYEPHTALAAGADGLEDYRRIIPALPDLLVPQGYAVLELGAGQAQPVAAIGQQAGLACLDTRKDLAGIERAIIFSKPE